MFKEILEGETKLLVPEPGKYGVTKKGRDKKPPVFYNPRMRLNRDICCSVVRVLMKGEEITFADILAGSGAKGIRVAKEAGCNVHLNDASDDAFQLIKRNAELNGLALSVSNNDANLFLQENRFNFIDIDPFGTPVPFLDNAIMRVKKKGYLGITATDTAPLCGVYPKACMRKYGALPLRSEFCHEVGLRILLGYTARTAAKYSRGLRCMLSHSTEHYFRAYVQLIEGKEKADKTLENLGYLYYCRNCMEREHDTGPLHRVKNCKCGRAYEVAGPLWLGKIEDAAFIKSVLKESLYLKNKKLERLLSTISEELEALFYYDIHKVCKAMKISAPTMGDVISKLEEDGYSVSRTHFSPTSIKTDAPLERLKLLLL